MQVSEFRGLEPRVAVVPAGATLEVTPWTGGTGDVTMALKPKVNVVVGRDAASGLPIIDTRSAEMTIRAHDGETIVVGGLRSHLRLETRRRIPVLGDLPLIGRLFRWRRGSEPQDDLVLFVTPRIVGTAAPAAG